MAKEWNISANKQESVTTNDGRTVYAERTFTGSVHPSESSEAPLTWAEREQLRNALEQLIRPARVNSFETPA